MSALLLGSSSIGYSGDFFRLPGKDKRSFPVSFIFSLALHAALLFFGGMVFVGPPQYGIDLGRGGMEVSLVARPLETVKEKLPSKSLINKKSLEREEGKDDALALPVFEKADGTKKAEARQDKTSVFAAALLSQRIGAGASSAVKNSPHHGDGNSPVAGADPTTFYAPGGAWTEARAGHLRNPAPAYPPTAVELGQEGLVVLSVWVSREGRVSRVEIKESSGFLLLDQSALNTIKKWKFNPGRLGLLAHGIWVTIPVRFRLEDAKQSS